MRKCSATFRDSRIFCAMRRSISLALLLLFGLLPLTPLFAPDSEANLPACCRRSGKHHCAMRMAGVALGGRTGFNTVSEKCPCYPIGVIVAHSTANPEIRRQILPAITSHLTSVALPKIHYRLWLDRSHRDRGPPLVAL